MPELRRRRQERTLRDWLEALPDEVVRGRAVLSTFAAWMRLVEGDLEGVEAACRDAERALTDDELRATIEVYRASAGASSR